MFIALHYDIATVAPLKFCPAKKNGGLGGRGESKITVIISEEVELILVFLTGKFENWRFI